MFWALALSQSLWRRANARKVIFHGGNSTFINSFDKTKFLFWSLPSTQHHSFFKNKKLSIIPFYLQEI